MSKTVEARGPCLCGAVTLETKSMSLHLGTCHCSICRKWGGGPMFAVDCGTDVSFSGAEHVARFSSSDWAERGFCSHCGTHLFYRLKESGQYIVPAGLMEFPEAPVFDHQIFIDEKPAYYDFANQTKTMTGAEVFAQFSQE
ncbi:MAG: GFA family protein [Oceanospirillales bacterium]|nr:GFA family protein [Oceanospirillales bacterium]